MKNFVEYDRGVTVLDFPKRLLEFLSDNDIPQLLFVLEDEIYPSRRPVTYA